MCTRDEAARLESTPVEWVFGYGSLMWRPGFPFAERRPATVFGYHRRACVRSIRFRGTPDQPGLVVGMDRGGATRGIAYRLAADDRDSALAYVRERERVPGTYVERHVTARLDDGRRIRALACVVDRAHPQCCGDLPLDDLIPIAAFREGPEGSSYDYLANTAAHLRDLGIRDRRLEALVAAARRLREAAGGR